MTESQTPATSQAPAASQAPAQPILKPHTNTVVPHTIADYDTDLVQLNVWTGTKWVNIFDGNDFKNTRTDLHQVAKVVETHTSEIQDATKTASDAVKAADSAISASKVNSDAIAAQGEAISEVKIALDSATTEIQQTASNAASDAANIRADVAKVESEVASAKSASQDSVNALQSDIDAAKKDLADAHSGLLNAQAAIDQNKKLINDSVAKINNDIAQNRNDLTAAQQANADTAKKLDGYTKQAIEQGKSIEELQTDGNSMKLTIVDIKGNVSQVQNSVTGLTASLKDANDNLATVKALANSLSSTLTDHGKNIASLQATTKELSSTLGDADGRLSKVEQTAKEQSTTLSTVQGDLSQVKQTADGLTDTLKDAQGNITKVQTTVKGLSEQITNAQGSITSLQTDVTGIKATITDHENDIHTLQADAKSLTDGMTDAQGNISSLQKTATSLDSELKDHDGRISKVEQTASTLTTEFSDEQGHLNRVEQTANGTKQAVADNAGNIATLQSDANKLASQVRSAQGDISALQQTASGISSRVSGVETSLADANSKINGITINGGGRNLLIGTSTLSGDVASGGGVFVKGAFNGYDAVKTNGAWGAWSERCINLQSALGRTNAKAGDWYTISVYVKADKQINTGGLDVYRALGNVDANANDGFLDRIPLQTKPITTQWQQYAWSFQINDISLQRQNTRIEYSQDTGDNWIYWAGWMLEKGIVAHDWSPAPEDTDAKITTNTTAIDQNKQAIALKADQSTVNTLSGEVSQNEAQLKVQADQISSKVSSEDFNTLDNKVGSAIAQIDKNTTAIDQNSKQISLKADQTEVDSVKNTATNNSSRLDVMANEIQSKVTSTDVNNIVDGKGYATTSTVQSLITQKAGSINESITNLTSEVNSNNGGGVNFAKNTINASYSGNSGSGNIGDISLDDMNELRGQTITLSVDVEWTGWQNASGNNRIGWELQVSYADGSTVNNWLGVWAIPTTASGKQRVSATYTIPDKKITSLGEGAVFVQANCTSAKVSRLKIERGSVATPYSPAPSDEATVTQVQQITASIDGIQSTVANKADESQITQLSNLVQSKVSTSDFNSKITQLANDINLRVTKGDLLSQINLTAGNTLIQSGKIYLDADSVVFGENSTAFIPSAYITDINADKITTGILKSISINNGDGAFTVNPAGDVVANSITVRNGNIFQGQIIGTGFYAINRITDTENEVTKFTSLDQVDDSIDEWFKLNGRIMEWHDGDNYASIGPAMPYLEPVGGKIVEATTSGLTMVGTNGVTISAGSKAEPGKVAPDYYIHNKQNISFALPTNIMVKDTEILVNLNPEGGNVNDNAGSQFHIWKDSKVDVYFGKGTNGNIIEFIAAGDGGAVNVRGAFNVFGAKNSAVKTSQGSVAVSAYETAEYYFGDLGTGNTGSQKRTVIGIEKLFNETVNTNIEYQVFVTSYSNARVWVSDRQPDRFVVESDVPNARFGYEIKAKRKGYENTRLAKVSE